MANAWRVAVTPTSEPQMYELKTANRIVDTDIQIEVPAVGSYNLGLNNNSYVLKDSDNASHGSIDLSVVNSTLIFGFTA